MIAGLVGYAGITFGSIWLINTINRVWTINNLPTHSAPLWQIEEVLASRPGAAIVYSEKSPSTSQPAASENAPETKS